MFFAWWAGFPIEAEIFEGPVSGTFVIGGPIPTPSNGTVSVLINSIGGLDPNEYVQVIASASVNGVSVSETTDFGLCPVDFCGHFPIWDDNQFGPHFGFGVSIFPISDWNRTLTIYSVAGTPIIFPGTNSSPIAIDFDVIIDVPGSLTPTPLRATLPLFLTGLGTLGLLGWRQKKKQRN